MAIRLLKGKNRSCERVNGNASSNNFGREASCFHRLSRRGTRPDIEKYRDHPSTRAVVSCMTIASETLAGLSDGTELADRLLDLVENELIAQLAGSISNESLASGHDSSSVVY